SFRRTLRRRHAGRRLRGTCQRRATLPQRPAFGPHFDRQKSGNRVGGRRLTDLEFPAPDGTDDVSGAQGKTGRINSSKHLDILGLRRCFAARRGDSTALLFRKKRKSRSAGKTVDDVDFVKQRRPQVELRSSPPPWISHAAES